MALAQRLAPRRGPRLEAVLGQQLTGVELDRRSVAVDAGLRSAGAPRLLELLDIDAQPVALRG